MIQTRSGKTSDATNLANHGIGLFGRLLFLALACLQLIIDQAEARPEMQPALIGNTPHSLVNRIDTKALVAQGQKSAVIMFQCYINQDGYLSARSCIVGPLTLLCLKRK